MDYINGSQDVTMAPHGEAEIKVSSTLPAVEYDGMEPAQEYSSAISENVHAQNLLPDEQIVNYATRVTPEREQLNVLTNDSHGQDLTSELTFDEMMPSQTKINIMSGPFYTVQRGDSLKNIARKFLGDDEKYKLIMNLNGLDSTQIIPGQVLKIPNNYKDDVILYRVNHGDSLWSLAQKFLGYGPRYTEIMSINDVTNDRIYPGQVLKIPKRDLQYVGNNSEYENDYSNRKFYIVKPGDSLWKIASRMLGNGNRYTEIIKLNNLGSRSIRVGQRILLP